MTAAFAAPLPIVALRRLCALFSCLLFIALSGPILGTTVAPPDFATLVNESDYVVHTVVKSVTSEWREKQGHRAIFTLVEVEVLEVINGTPPQPLVLEMLGGRVGSEEMVVQGMPEFVAGQEDILFVRGNGRQFYPLTAAMHGRYPIVHEKGGRIHVARSNHVPLTNTAEVKLPLDGDGIVGIKQEVRAGSLALSPDDFTRQIRAAVDPNYRHSERVK
jgi:hypothetical protein